ncbi:MAG: leucine-rich repeat protein [Clostridia bacterium]|nr:leucine-rich repeat protein [Clostridia bacterium]
MKKTRKILLTVLSVLTVASVSLGAASCELIGLLPLPNSSTPQTTDNEFRQVYAMYVTYAEEQGITPLSYEAWLMSVRGEKGDKGEQGEQGPAGEDGKDGVDGEDGQDGLTPYVGENGNWWIGDIDTGIQATGDKGDKGDKGEQGEQGPQGEKGDKGDQGEQGPAGADGEDGKDGADGKSAYQIWLDAGHEGTEDDFLAWLKGATGEKGDQGDKGDKGDQGVGIEKVEYDADGNLVITFTDGTTQTVVMPEPETHVHTFGDWTQYSDPDAANQVLFRVCLTCSQIEWKLSSHTAHNWTVVTTPPTCQAQGYDTKTCSICGKVEVENYTDIIDHAWATEYTFDNSFHWYECNTCDEIKDKAEHTPDESGECSVCKALVGATEGVVYDVFDGGAYAGVIGYEGTATRVRIADTYNGLPVKTIYDQAFNNNDKITSVIIPDNVTSIGSRAFDDCDSLTSVVIGDSVTSIGERAFSFCDSLTSVEIPDSVTSIGDYAFNSCSSLTFNEYGNCQYLGNEENPYHALIQAKTENYSAYTIHEDTKVIADYAFSGCTRMSSIVIPDSVTSIGNGAFSFCDSLTSVEIPDSVTSIGGGAFCGCSNLTSVEIPDSVTSIGYEAFVGCSSLTSVYYKGTASEWSAISIGWSNSSLTNATKYYYSETEPTEEGNYWHYVDGVPTKW